MSLSNTTALEIVPPVTGYSPNYAKFELPYTHIFSDIDHIGGMFASTGTDATSAMYPTIPGAYASMTRLVISVLGTEVDNVDSLPLAAVEMARTTNSGSRDYSRFTALNGLGFTEWEGSDDASVAPGALTLNSKYNDYFNQFDTAGTATNIVNSQIPLPVSRQGQNTTIKLRKLSGFLQSMDILPPLKGLTIEIFYDTNPATYFNDAGKPIVNFQPDLIPPMLLIRKQLGQTIPPSVKIPYMRKITTTMGVPEVTNANAVVPLVTDMLVTAYNEKPLRAIMTVKQTATDLAAANRWLTLASRSPAMLNETTNIFINDKQTIPGSNGIDNPALRACLFERTFGGLNMPFVSYLPTIGDTNNRILAPDTQALVGQFSITGYPVKEPITYKYIHQVSRTYQADAAYPWQNAAYTEYIIGLCEATVIVSQDDQGVDYCIVADGFV